MCVHVCNAELINTDERFGFLFCFYINSIPIAVNIRHAERERRGFDYIVKTGQAVSKFKYA